MSLLFRTVMTSECTCLNHLLAMDALRHLECPQSGLWVDLFTRYYEEYLSGSTAPDRKIKDFDNQVYFVKDQWGGADQAATEWYDRTIEALRAQKWREAVYSAAVAGHYFCDAILPFHTDFSREGMAIHGPADWCITSCYGQLQRILGDEYPDVDVPPTSEWISALAKQEAKRNVGHTQMLVDHFSLSATSRSPHLGFDQDAKECLAEMVGAAVTCISKMIDAAIVESEAIAPRSKVGVMGLLASSTKPFAWFSQWLATRTQKGNTKRILKELEQTNRLVVSMNEHDRSVAEQFSEEVLDQGVESLFEQELGEIGERYGTGSPVQNLSLKVITTLPEMDYGVVEPDFKEADDDQDEVQQSQPSNTSKAGGKPKLKVLLTETDPVENTPGLHPKIARRLSDLDIRTVGDLLDEDTSDLATQLNMAQVDTDTVAHWQASAELVCSVPRMQPHYAQVLVACGIASPQELAEFDPETLLELIEPFLRSTEGREMLQNAPMPTQKEVGTWIKCAIFAERRAA